MRIYRIRNWSTLYENNRTRELKRMDWVPIPNKMDGAGYTRLVDHPNGAAHFGAWVALVEIASRSEVRGTLVRDGVALSCEDLGRISHLGAALFTEALPRFVDSIKWLEIVEIASEPQTSAVIPQDDAEECLRARAHISIPFPSSSSSEGDARGNYRPPKAALTDLDTDGPPEFCEFWGRYPQKVGRDAAVRLWVTQIPVSDHGALFACLERWEASEQWARAVYSKPDKWLLEGIRTRWGDHPAAARKRGGGTAEDIAGRL